MYFILEILFTQLPKFKKKLCFFSVIFSGQFSSFSFVDIIVDGIVNEGILFIRLHQSVSLCPHLGNNLLNVGELSSLKDEDGDGDCNEGSGPA